MNTEPTKITDLTETKKPEHQLVITGNKIYVVRSDVNDPFLKIQSGEMDGITLVSRNRVCYCNSGKRFKNCCMKKFPITSVTRTPYKMKHKAKTTKQSQGHDVDGPETRPAQPTTQDSPGV